MSYSQPLINQPKILFFSIGAGILLGICYVLIQGVFRIFGEGRLSYYLADSAFVIVFTLVSFFFMVLHNEGRVRLHLIIGEAVGILLFRFSVGRYIYAVLARLSGALRLLFRPYVFIFRSFIRGTGGLFKAAAVKISSLCNKKGRQTQTEEKRIKKINLFGKIHLKNQDKSV